MANEIQADYPSGGLLYAVIRNRQGQTWYPPGKTFESWGSGGHSAADYPIILTDKGGSRHIGDFDVNIPTGAYWIQIFVQAGGSPADTDSLVCSRDFFWTGVGELTATKILINKSVQDKATLAIDYYDDDGQTVLLRHDVENTAALFKKSPSQP